MRPSHGHDATTRRLSFDALLNALDGVAYVVAPDGVILQVGEPRWSDNARGHSAPGLIGDLAVGRNLFDMSIGPDVKAVQERMHRQVIDGGAPVVSFEYRCDRPEKLRRMRLSITPLIDGPNTIAALYHSIMLEEVLRPPLDLFKSFSTDGNCRHDVPIVTLCSYCHDVSWPTRTESAETIWIAPEDYYRRGGGSEVLVSHGMCPDCYTRLMSA
ncbi:MAG: hypothetical protein AB7O49_13175 [Sphingomonadales bacterium]